MVRADDALLSMLMPAWQAAIGGCAVLTLVVAGLQLRRRGRSRMGTALTVVGAAVIGIVLLGILMS